MSEWLKEHAWKACVGETLPWVRIPLSPPIPYINFCVPGIYKVRRAHTSSYSLRADACRQARLSRVTDRTGTPERPRHVSHEQQPMMTAARNTSPYARRY